MEVELETESVSVLTDESVAEEEEELRTNESKTQLLNTLLIRRYDRDLEEDLKKSAQETEQYRVERAAHYVRDALGGKSVYHRTGEWCDRAHWMQVNSRPQAVLIVVCLVHLCMAFFEAPSWRDADSIPYWQRTVLRVVELLCIFVYLIFMAARLMLLGRPGFLKKWYNIMLGLLIALLFIDVVTALCFDLSFRFSRALRPLLLIVYIRKFRHMLQTLVNSLPSIADVLVLLLFLILTFGIIGLQLFANSGIYENQEENFDNFLNTFIALSTLITTENFPDIMYPALEKSSYFVIYFVVFMLFAILLMSTLAAVTFNVYVSQFRRRVVQNRVTERRGLLAAFRSLDSNDMGFIKFPQFLRLVRALYPKIQVEQVHILFDTLDQDGTRKLDILEFFHLTDVLQLKFKQQTDRKFLPEFIIKKWASLVPRTHIKMIVDHRAFEIFMAVVIGINVLILCLYRRGMSQTEINLYTVLDYILLFIYVVEATLKMLADGFRAYWKNGWNRVDLAVVIFGTLFILLQSGGVLSTSTGVWVGAFRSLRLIRVLRVIQLMKFGERFIVLTDLFINMTGIFMIIGGTVLINCYIFGIIGMELFSHQLDDYSDPHTNFDSVGSTLLLLFQLLVSSQWHNIMDATSIGTGTKWCSIYFLIFHFFVVVTTVNILIGLILETFDANKFDFKVQRNLLVEVYGSDADSNPNKWKVKSQRRRWSRDLFKDEAGKITTAEIAALKRYSHLDLVKSSEEKEQFEKRRGHPSDVKAVGQKIMEIMYRDRPRDVRDRRESQPDPQKVVLQDDEEEEMSIEMLKEVFDEFDVDKSSTITREEFSAIIQHIALKMESYEVDMLFMVLDTNDDGRIYWEEFAAWFNDLKHLAASRKAQELNQD